MTERFTGVQPRRRLKEASFLGVSARGRVDRRTMLAVYRDHYERQRREAEIALAVKDDELVVETYLGSVVMRDREEVL